ncbi:MAG TPA: glycosyltransferase family 4 protein [Candidatus Hydrothermia bacterium]|nr:glycosyltransferase family 4 protein [Candidatus Hydrothermia bacterium]
MRILIISPWCDDIDLETCRGTPENAYLFAGLLKRDHRIYFICQGNYCEIPINMRNQIVSTGVKRFPWVWPSRLNFVTFPIFHPSYGQYLSAIVEDTIKRENIEIVYNIAGYGHPELVRTCKKLKTPYAVKTMGTILFTEKIEEPLGKLLYYKEHLIFSYKPDHYFCVDDGTGTYKVTKHYGIDKKLITILPNARPDIKITKNDVNLPPVCGYFSRFDRLKGTDLFCKIVKKVLRKTTNIKFLVAGEGTLKRYIQKLCDEYPQNVFYLGYLPYIKMLQYYQKIDLLISTNRYSNLTLPTIEALSHGVPVIAFDTQETSRLLKDGLNGFLVKPFEVEEAVYKITNGAEDANLLKKLSLSALESASSIPTWEERITLEINKLEELIQ